MAQDPASAARAASEQLSLAAEALAEADGAQNRVKALTQVIAGYEDGLEAMRDGLRRASLREQALGAELQAREAEIAQLLGVLSTMGNAPVPVLLMHPSGPVGTARAGMILSEVAPALDARALELRDKVQELSVLRVLQQSAADKLQEGLEGVQEARTALSTAIAERTDLPRRFTEDPVRTALLIASTETLEGFASGLSEIAVDEAPGSLPDITARKGALPLPAECGGSGRRRGRAPRCSLGHASPGACHRAQRGHSPLSRALARLRKCDHSGTASGDFAGVCGSRCCLWSGRAGSAGWQSGGADGRSRERR